MTKAERADKAEAIEGLRKILKPGDTVYTVLESVSRSGMSRVIRVVVPTVTVTEVQHDTGIGAYTESKTAVSFLHPNHAVGLVIGARQAKRGDGLIVGGCGMDMGFHLVYELSHALYGARLVPDIYPDAATHDQPDGQLLTRDGAPAGMVYLGGYACLGKGTDHARRCPSNYHSNHRDHVQCPNHCYAELDLESTGRRWTGQRLIDNGDEAPYPCTSCERGYVPNPDGPERWDLIHTDGYALRQQWL